MTNPKFEEYKERMMALMNPVQRSDVIGSLLGKVRGKVTQPVTRLPKTPKASKASRV